VALDDCIHFTGYIRPDGYGGVRVDGRQTTAHVIAYVEARGPLPTEPPPDGSKRWEIHHRCENPSCINPDHLELLSVHEHKMRHATRITVCKHGHELTEENRAPYLDRYVCLTCKRRRGREHMRRKRAAARFADNRESRRA
jgi:hypothetical protein